MSLGHVNHQTQIEEKERRGEEKAINQIECSSDTRKKIS